MSGLPAMRIRPVFGLVLLALVAGVPVRHAGAHSLADLARKEEERRKAQPAPTKVYTNKDLAPAPPGSPAPAAPATAPGAAPSGTADPATAPGEPKPSTAAKPSKDADSGKGPAYWAGRLKALNEKLDRDVSFADALQSRINALNTDFVNRDDPAQRAAIERDRQKATAQLTSLQKDVVADRKAIADLQEEARRAGVPPGWLR